LMREKAKESLWIGGLSFLFPFLGAMAFAYWGLGWSVQASQIAGVALSTTSLAVVYAVLVETGLTHTPIGKLIMASTFVTDFGTALALSVLFIQPSLNILWFIGVSIALIVLMPRLAPPFFARYGNRVIEPEIKLIFVALFVLMFFGELGASHAVLPAFILGLAMSKRLTQERAQQQRLRVVTFALLTPFFFFKSGMNVSLSAVLQNWSWLLLLLGVKLAAKFVGVYPVSRRYVEPHAWYTTLLMSTGLTFGTISSLYGLNAGILDRAQFSVLITVVVLSAVVPTFIAQRFFSPALPDPAVPASTATAALPAQAAVSEAAD
ncbi:MAG: cation:proton antiporter, partial [Chloroflexi bacterium]|nr:cation:proton antiporter [Chloroflexota bacterium]